MIHKVPQTAEVWGFMPSGRNTVDLKNFQTHIVDVSKSDNVLELSPFFCKSRNIPMAKKTSFVSTTTAHLRRNKWKYGIGTALAAAAAGTYLLLRNSPVGEVAAVAVGAIADGVNDAGEVVATAAEAAVEAVA